MFPATIESVPFGAIADTAEFLSPCFLINSITFGLKTFPFLRKPPSNARESHKEKVPFSDASRAELS